LQLEMNDKTPVFNNNVNISRPALKHVLKEIAADLTDQQLEQVAEEIGEDGSGKTEFK
ncbi:hypothetical protein Angca_000825, partial [Angiostrongylus cantonensis]